jgi:hypothetical protein
MVLTNKRNSLGMIKSGDKKMLLNSKSLNTEILQVFGQELSPKCTKERTHKHGLTMLETLIKFMILILGIFKNISHYQKKRKNK